ncbi:MAG TPA: AAA family ATPase [Tepidisphaeraceae bacterium]|jgi:hypothetical protein
MWDVIGDIFIVAGEALSGAGRPAKASEARKPSRLGLPIGIICGLGAAGSVYAMFFQGNDLWQIAKLLLLAMILGVCSALGFHEFRARRRFHARERAAAGLCARCGYDLRGNTSGVCPECGARRAAAAARPAPAIGAIGAATVPERAGPATVHVLGPQPGTTTAVAAVRFSLKEEVDRLFDAPSIPADGKPAAVIVMGGVATGKTTFRKQRYSHGYVLIDAVDIFLHLSGEQVFPFPGPFRMPMDLIGRSVAHRALAERRNVVTEIIGAEGDSARQLIDAMQSLGYAVRAEVVTCDVAEALRRNATRGADSVSAYYAEPFQREWILTACAELAGAREA